VLAYCLGTREERASRQKRTAASETTDALRDGFEETLWIDSDIGFHPDAIERTVAALREYRTRIDATVCC
jgi:hypothetical protein